MTKNELIDNMALNAGISRKSANKALEALSESIILSLKKGERISLKGLGSWTVYKRAARVGRNPRTNESLNIPSKNTLKFKVSPQLINYLNQKK
ncbi:MAG: HU family DNA-binding protein [Formosa sp.]|jgi:DNA-binding protein HU-beta|nr:HU family DNA-binding protein [Formosa sp.]MDC0463902.1 HU family DNA-binding protein [Flavobacteriaceae bacterium]|tara:strand:- start:5992 stop:6273 length:282 start_codon:yes stop_codon:yes gene_type:complete